MEIKICANRPCGEKFTSAGKNCEACNTRAKREDQIKQNLAIVEKRLSIHAKST